MEKEKQRMCTRFKNGQRKFGILADSAGEIMYVEDWVQNIALDAVESYIEISKGEKKQEETNIDLQMALLSALSNALKSLGTVLYH